MSKTIAKKRFNKSTTKRTTEEKSESLVDFAMGELEFLTAEQGDTNIDWKDVSGLLFRLAIKFDESFYDTNIRQSNTTTYVENQRERDAIIGNKQKALAMALWKCDSDLAERYSEVLCIKKPLGLSETEEWSPFIQQIKRYQTTNNNTQKEKERMLTLTVDSHKFHVNRCDSLTKQVHDISKDDPREYDSRMAWRFMATDSNDGKMHVVIVKIPVSYCTIISDDDIPSCVFSRSACNSQDISSPNSHERPSAIFSSGKRILDLAHDEKGIEAIIRLATKAESESVAKTEPMCLPSSKQPHSSQDNTPSKTSTTYGCITEYNDFESVLCKNIPYPLNNAKQAQAFLRYLCKEGSLSKDTAKTRAEIHEHLESLGLVTKGIKWRAHSPFGGRLHQLGQDAFRPIKMGLYWINP